MDHLTEIGGAVVMSKEFFAKYTTDVTQLAAKTAIEQYKIEASKDEKLTVTEIAKQEKCSRPTVIEWINTGIKKGKLKLLASKKNGRDYIITRFDLNRFLEAKQALYN